MYLFLSVTILLLICGRVFNLGTIWIPDDFDLDSDAQAISQATDRNAELIRIFPRRTTYMRQQIVAKYNQMNSGKPLIPYPYVPLRGDPFQDLLFAMVSNPMETYTTYLHAALQSMMPEAFGRIIIEILILTDFVKESLVQAYNSNPVFEKSLLDTVSTFTVNDYKHFLQEIVQRRREYETSPWSIDTNDVNEKTQILVQECQGWDDNRKMLDYILMNKSMNYAQQVILRFTQANNGVNISDAIDANIPDQNLKFGYKSLVKLITTPYQFLIERIYDGENDPFDQHATNTLIITAFSEFELYEIDSMFGQRYGQNISQYLLSRNSKDSTIQMLAAMAGG